MMKLSIVLIAIIIRISLIFYGTFHDCIMDVQFTDIDYSVFTEAAEFLANGQSPYLKTTYKYTPLLAYILIPNIYIHELFGKFLFCIFDLFVGFVLHDIMKQLFKTISDTSDALICCCWLFNPFTMTISSRGNAESIQIFLVVLTLLFTIKNQLFLSAVCFGLSVHFKLYPIIYLIPVLLYIGSRHCAPRFAKTRIEHIKNLFSLFINIDTVWFSFVSLFTFSSIGLLMYTR